MGNRILLIEDDVDLDWVIKNRLENEGYEVHVEVRGEGGLQSAESFQPDLVILDLNLPDVDGFEVCHQLRRQFHETPILILTADVVPEKQLRGFFEGADAFLSKPYDGAQLVKEIHFLLTR